MHKIYLFSLLKEYLFVDKWIEWEGRERVNNNNILCANDRMKQRQKKLTFNLLTIYKCTQNIVKHKNGNEKKGEWIVCLFVGDLQCLNEKCQR